MERFTAFLLKKIKYGDHSFILQTFTREEGLVSFFVRGSAVKGKTRTVLEPMSHLDIIAVKGKGDLYSIREIKSEKVYYDINGNIYKSSILMFVNEVLIKSLKIQGGEPYLFDYVADFMTFLNDVERGFENYHLIFLSGLCEHLGFYPNGKYSEDSPVFDLIEGTFSKAHPIHNHFISGDMSRSFSQLHDCNFESATTLLLTNQERRNMLGHLLDYYKIHLDQFDELKSRAVLETILA